MKIPKSKHQITNNLQKGYLAISSILIISAVVLALTISVSYLAIGEGQVSLAQFKGEETRALIEGCAEDALSKLRRDPNYSGETIVRPEGTCTIYIGIAGDTYTLSVFNGVGYPYFRAIQVVVSRDYLLTLTSWSDL